MGLPENQIRMGHKIGDSFQHAPGFQDEGRESDPGQVHSYSARNPIVRRISFGEPGMSTRNVADLN